MEPPIGGMNKSRREFKEPLSPPYKKTMQAAHSQTQNQMPININRRRRMSVGELGSRSRRGHNDRKDHAADAATLESLHSPLHSSGARLAPTTGSQSVGKSGSRPVSHRHDGDDLNDDDDRGAPKLLKKYLPVRSLMRRVTTRSSMPASSTNAAAITAGAADARTTSKMHSSMSSNSTNAAAIAAAAAAARTTSKMHSSMSSNSTNAAAIAAAAAAARTTSKMHSSMSSNSTNAAAIAAAAAAAARTTSKMHSSMSSNSTNAAAIAAAAAAARTTSNGRTTSKMHSSMSPKSMNRTVATAPNSTNAAPIAAARPQPRNRRPDPNFVSLPLPHAGTTSKMHSSMSSNSMNAAAIAAAAAAATTSPNNSMNAAPIAAARPQPRNRRPDPNDAAGGIVNTEPKPNRGATVIKAKAKPVALYKKGMEVYYRRGNNPTMKPALILDVHYDDLLEPYYTIRLRGEDGSEIEKQTDDAHLALSLPTEEEGSPPPRAGGDANAVEDERPAGSRSPTSPSKSPRPPRGVRATSNTRGERGVANGLYSPRYGEVGTCSSELSESGFPNNTGDGIVLKSIGLKCHALDVANAKVREPADGPGALRGNSKKLQRAINLEPPEDPGHSFIAKDSPRDKPSGPLTERERPIRTRRSTGAVAPDVNIHPKVRRSRRSTQGSHATAPALDPPSQHDLSKSLVIPGSSPAERARPLLRRHSSVITANVNNCLDLEPKRNEEEPQKQPCVNNDASKESENCKQRTLSTTEPDSTLASSFESGNEDLKCLATSFGLTRKDVRDFRCSDSNQDFGFYTGTVATFAEFYTGTMDEKDVPHGKGEMVYDDGSIQRGLWSKGTLDVKAPTASGESDRYEPRLLSGYDLGGAGLPEDMVRATAAAVSMLHVGDCAFVRRSNSKKRWTYAIVKSRNDGGDVSIKFQASAGRSTKTVEAAQWTRHIRLPVFPELLPGYKVGDRGRDEDMIVASREETVVSVSKLKRNDAAFVHRSNGDWVYATVKGWNDDRDAKVTFVIDQDGRTKSIRASQCGRHVRRINQVHQHCSGEEGTGHDYHDDDDGDKTRHQLSLTKIAASTLYANHHHDANDDKTLSTQDTGSYFKSGSSLAVEESSILRSQDVLRLTTMAHQRHETAMEHSMGADCSVDSSFAESDLNILADDESLKQKWDTFNMIRRASSSGSRTNQRESTPDW